MNNFELKYCLSLLNTRIKAKLVHSFIIIIFLSFNSHAQDVHFSSFDVNPMFLNPANSGFSSASFRLGTMYRNQWSTVSKGYNSYLFSAEALLYNNRARKEGIGIGVNFLSDVAGSLSYGQQNIGLSVSYFKAIEKKSEHYISVGIQGNSSKWGYDLTHSVFGRELEDIEGIQLNTINTLDFGMGVHWQLKANQQHYLQAGIALLHINQPTLSYYEDSDIKLPTKFNFYFSDLISLTELYSIKPTIFFQRQNQYQEIIIGSDLNINMSETTLDSKMLSFGAYYRAIDAFIAMIKYKHDNINIGLSYDINLSKLTPASKTYGGVELWLLYSFNSLAYTRKTTSIPCPRF